MVYRIKHKKNMLADEWIGDVSLQLTVTQTVSEELPVCRRVVDRNDYDVPQQSHHMVEALQLFSCSQFCHGVD